MAIRRPALVALAAAVVLTAAVPAAGALAQPSPQPAPAEQAAVADNEELAAMFEADQAARSSGPDIDWSVVSVEDAERRARTRELLEAGQVNSARDYYHAAFIFQHGGEPDDYLLAHVLAVTAISKGHARAPWIAAATLDRYLQNIGRPQIYGTQYMFPRGGGEVTQGEYDQDLLPDALRGAAGVPTLEAQEDRRREMQAQMEQSSTGD